MKSAAEGAVLTGGKMATVEVLGEGVRRQVPVPEAGATARQLLRAAGVTVRETGWDLFVGGVRHSVDDPLNGHADTNISYVPRTKGA
jgi:hypothetical protein